VTMRLHPPELGDLTMRVAVNGRDVSAWFASPQPQVQAAISAALGQLQTDLGGAGYNLAGAWVGGDTSGARQQGWNNSPAASQVGASLAAAAAAPAAAVSQPSSSGLNIYV
jgi:flagellar hook-length control protein FliK